MTSQPNTDLERFCQKLPKIELHAHLTGSISRECLHEIWATKKLADPTLSTEDPLIIIPPGKVDYDLQTFFPLFSKYIYNLCNDVSSVVYSTTAVLTDFENDGIVYLELRTTPRVFQESGLTTEVYVEAVLGAIEHYEAVPRTMKTTLILSIDRRDSVEKAQQCVDLAIKYQHRGVVGVDLCGDPLKGDITTFREPFSRAKSNGLGITLHFAEAKATSSDEELMMLLSYEPDRLGHVVHVSDRVKDEIMKRRLALELCLSCNVHAKFVGSFPEHHFGEWWGSKSCPLVVCTDDVGVFCSPGSNEYLLAATHFGLSKAELWELSYGAVEAIFTSQDEKDGVKKLLEAWKAANVL